MQRPSFWLESVKNALSILGNGYGAQQYTGQHTGQFRLSDMLRHDLVQSSTLLSAKRSSEAQSGSEDISDIEKSDQPAKNDKDAPIEGTSINSPRLWGIQMGAIA
jgi:hypothetical protein